jgi:hypothetical protein
MKKFFGCLMGAVLAAVLVLAGCASSGGAANDNLVAGEGETLVTVQRESSFVGSAIKYEVYIDGNPVLKLSNGATGKAVVPNGEHTIYVKAMRPKFAGGPIISEELDFTADSTERYFRTKPDMNDIVLEADY